MSGGSGSQTPDVAQLPVPIVPGDDGKEATAGDVNKLGDTVRDAQQETSSAITEMSKDPLFGGSLVEAKITGGPGITNVAHKLGAKWRYFIQLQSVDSSDVWASTNQTAPGKFISLESQNPDDFETLLVVFK